MNKMRLDIIPVPEIKKEAIKATVGFSECANKNSFITGAEIAFRVAEVHFTEIIAEMKQSGGYYKDQYEETIKDLATLTSIIAKYTDIDTDF